MIDGMIRLEKAFRGYIQNIKIQYEYKNG